MSRLRNLMCRAIRFKKVKGNSDDGAIAILIILFFSSFVLIGLLAIVIDVGSQYQERRVLQKAADSMALAIGQDCVENNRLGLCVGTSGPNTLHPAIRYASVNSDDRFSKVVRVCGRGGGLPECTEDSDRLLDCKPLSGSADFVRVRLATQSPSGGNSLKLRFGRLLGDVSSSSQLRACAQVRYGAAQEAPVIFPLALTICGYQDVSDEYVYLDAKTGGNSLVKSPDFVNSIYVYKKNSDESVNTYKTLRQWEFTALTAGLCKYKPVGLDWIPQGDLAFMTTYLQQNETLNGAVLFNCVGKNPDSECLNPDSEGICPNLFEPLDISVGDFVRGIPEGNASSIPNNCNDNLTRAGFNQNTSKKKYEAYLNEYVVGKTVYIPVFRSFALKSNGDVVGFKVIGFYSVQIKGISLGSAAAAGITASGGSALNNASWPNPSCRNSGYCISGLFTRSTPPSRRAPSNGENLGVGYVFLVP